MNYDNQSHFLASQCLDVSEVKRRYTKENISRRHCSVTYYIPVENGKIRICQKTLCDILKITARRLQILQKKIKFNKSLTDKRGKHCNRPHKISENVIALIKSHIESFPKQESHYSRGKTRTHII